MSNLKLLRPNVSAEDEEPPLLNLSRLLRNIADNIDAGEYGIKEAQERWGADAVVRGALMLRVSNQEPQIFGLGPTQVPQTYMDLHAGAQELMSMRSPERGL